MAKKCMPRRAPHKGRTGTLRVVEHTVHPRNQLHQPYTVPKMNLLQPPYHKDIYEKLVEPEPYDRSDPHSQTTNVFDKYLEEMRRKMVVPRAKKTVAPSCVPYLVPIKSTKICDKPAESSTVVIKQELDDFDSSSHAQGYGNSTAEGYSNPSVDPPATVTVHICKMTDFFPDILVASDEKS